MSMSSITPKEIGNLVEGISTYGICEYMVFLDNLFYNCWTTTASVGNMGLLGGLVITTLATRLALTPITLYGLLTGQKMKLLQPDNDEIQAKFKQYSKQGNREAANIERNKLTMLRRRHGIYPLINLLNILQIPIHMIYISMINRLSYDVDINPAIMTDGILWFKDLSSPDPYCVLPVIGGLISFLNIITSSASRAGAPGFMKNAGKFLKLMPLISIPIWMTFPSAFNIYWIMFSLVQTIMTNAFRFKWFRIKVGLPDYLPGSKLEALHAKPVAVNLEKPKIYKTLEAAKQMGKQNAKNNAKKKSS